MEKNEETTLNVNTLNENEIPDASQYTSGNKSNRDYYKSEEESFTFGLKNLLVSEDYSLWNDGEKRFDRGTVIDAAGREQKVSDTMYMPKKEFEKAFPKHRKTFRYVRDIVISGVDYAYAFKKTQNDELMKAIQSVRGLGQDPFEVNYLLEKKTKDGSKLSPSTAFNNILYTITPTKGDVVPKGDDGVVAGADVVDVSEPKITDEEKEIFDSVMKNPEEFRTEKVMVAAYRAACEKVGKYDGALSDDRAKYIFAELSKA